MTRRQPRPGVGSRICGSPVARGQLVARWRVLRVIVGEEQATALASNGGLNTQDVNDLIAEWARAGNDIQIPASKLQNAGGAATDQVARDAAAAAQGELDTHEGSPHNHDSTARMAAVEAGNTATAAANAAASASSAVAAEACW